MYILKCVCVCVDERLKNKLVALTMTASCTQVPRVTLINSIPAIHRRYTK